MLSDRTQELSIKLHAALNKDKYHQTKIAELTTVLKQIKNYNLAVQEAIARKNGLRREHASTKVTSALVIKDEVVPALFDFHAATERTYLFTCLIQDDTKAAALLQQSGLSFDNVTTLFGAIEQDKFTFFNFLLDNGANPLLCNREKDTLLTLAIKRHRTVFIDRLVSILALVNKLGANKESPLWCASVQGNRLNCDLLLEKGANKLTRLHHGHTLLTYAIKKEHTFSIEFALEDDQLLDVRGEAGLTPIMVTIAKGIMPLTRRLIDRGVDLLAKYPEGHTLLTKALLDDTVWVVELLRNNRRLVNLAGKDGLTPLMIAIGKDNEDNFQTFLAQIDDIDQKDNHGNTALLVATIMNDEAAVQHLLERNANPTIENNAGYSPLTYAAAKSYGAILEKFLPLLTVEQQQKALIQALFCAASNNVPDLVRNILDKKVEGVHVDLQNEEGETILSIFCRHGNSDFVNVLIGSYLANLNLANLQGYTALMFACGLKHADIVPMLLRNGVRANAVENGSHFTALHIAVIAKSVYCVQALLARGADANALTKQRQTPLMLAIFSQQNSIMKLLLESGADVSLKDASGYSSLDYAISYKLNRELLNLFNAVTEVNKLSKFFDEQAYYAEIDLISNLYARFPDLIVGYLQRLATSFGEGILQERYFQLLVTQLLILTRADDNEDRYFRLNCIVGEKASGAIPSNRREKIGFTLMYFLEAAASRDVNAHTHTVYRKIRTEYTGLNGLNDQLEAGVASAIDVEIRAAKDRVVSIAHRERLIKGPRLLYAAFPILPSHLESNAELVNFDGSLHTIYQHESAKELIRGLMCSSDKVVACDYINQLLAINKDDADALDRKVAEISDALHSPVTRVIPSLSAVERGEVLLSKHSMWQRRGVQAVASGLIGLTLSTLLEIALVAGHSGFDQFAKKFIQRISTAATDDDATIAGEVVLGVIGAVVIALITQLAFYAKCSPRAEVIAEMERDDESQGLLTEDVRRSGYGATSINV